jgi:dTDP-4-dehydrorhamnose 3,5-epimerase
VLRGLHYQIENAQGKLVRVIEGEVFDVAVDLRRSSPTFKRWVGVTLSAQNNRQFWLPPGFAHGFLVTSERATFLYKTTDYYSPQFDRTLAWNDPTLAIDWPLHGIGAPEVGLGAPPFVSAKDAAGKSLANADTYA